MHDAAGGCAPFCDLPQPTTASDEVHGSWCLSRAVGHEVDASIDGAHIEVTVDRARPRANPDQVTIVRLVLDATSPDHPRIIVHLTSGAVRTLAATLTRAADLADELAI